MAEKTIPLVQTAKPQRDHVSVPPPRGEILGRDGDDGRAALRGVVDIRRGDDEFGLAATGVGRERDAIRQPTPLHPQSLRARRRLRGHRCLCGRATTAAPSRAGCLAAGSSRAIILALLPSGRAFTGFFVPARPSAGIRVPRVSSLREVAHVGSSDLQRIAVGIAVVHGADGSCSRVDITDSF